MYFIILLWQFTILCPISCPHFFHIFILCLLLLACMRICQVYVWCQPRSEDIIHLGSGVMDPCVTPCWRWDGTQILCKRRKYSTSESWFQSPWLQALMSACFLTVDKIPGICNLQNQGFVFNHTFNILIYCVLFTKLWWGRTPLQAHLDGREDRL